jgi:hypothetical protein
MTRKILAFALLSTLVMSSLAQAGGRAVIQVGELPKSFVAGQTVPVSFTITNVEGRPLKELHPTVIATLGKRRVEVRAVATKQEGGYQAAVRFPSAGEWTLTVDSKYCQNTNVIHGVQVLAAK